MADWMEELERLAELRDKGLITDEEFEVKRKQLVDDSIVEKTTNETSQNNREAVDSPPDSTLGVSNISEEQPAPSDGTFSPEESPDLKKVVLKKISQNKKLAFPLLLLVVIGIIILVVLSLAGEKKEPTAQNLFETVKKTIPYDSEVECFRYEADDPYLPRAVEHGTCEDFVFVRYETNEEMQVESFNLATRTINLGLLSSVLSSCDFLMMRGKTWIIYDSNPETEDTELWEKLAKATGARDYFYVPSCSRGPVAIPVNGVSGTYTIFSVTLEAEFSSGDCNDFFGENIYDISGGELFKPTQKVERGGMDDVWIQRQSETNATAQWLYSTCRNRTFKNFFVGSDLVKLKNVIGDNYGEYKLTFPGTVDDWSNLAQMEESSDGGYFFKICANANDC